MGDAIGEGLDGDHGVHANCIWQDASVSQEEALYFPRFAFSIDDGVLGIAAHFAAAHVVTGAYYNLILLRASRFDSLEIGFYVARVCVCRHSNHVQ